MRFGLLLIVLFVFCKSANASHIMGGEISYQYLGNNKYLITARILRDCKGGPLNNITFGIFAGTNGNKACGQDQITSFTRISIKDISEKCVKNPAPCYPANTSATGAGIEEHIYTDTANFNDTLYQTYLKSGCCEISFYARSSSTRSGTTIGTSGYSFAINCTLNICNLNKCKVKSNSSALWNTEVTNTLCCNKGYKINAGASRNNDSDSIKYELTIPLDDISSSTISYTSPYSYKYPVTCYCVPPTTIKCTPNLKTDPPRGTYFDTVKGILTYTPTKCDEISVIAVKATEYRKDTTGKYLEIGSSRRDFLNIVRDDCGYNYAPAIAEDAQKYTYHVCEGQTLNFAIQTSDKTFTPYATVDDTTRIRIIDGPKNCRLKYADSTVRERRGIVEWKTQKGDSRTQPYQIEIEVNDFHCPHPEKVFATYNIIVHPNSDSTSSFSVKNNYCDGVDFSLSYQTSKPDNYLFNIYDSASNKYLFIKTGIRVFNLNEGHYYAKLLLLKDNYCLPSNGPQYFSIKNTSAASTGRDTAICTGGNAILSAFFTNPKHNHYKYQWVSYNAKLTPDTGKNLLVKNITSYDFFYVNITDSFGCGWTSPNYPRALSLEVTVNPYPKIFLRKDTSICPNTKLNVSVASDYANKYLWSTGQKATKITVSPGIYTIAAWDTSTHCVSKDTLLIAENTLPKITTETALYSCFGVKEFELNDYIYEDNVKTTGFKDYKPISYNSDRKSILLKSFAFISNSRVPKTTATGIWLFGYSGTRNSCPVADSIALSIVPVPASAFSIAPATVSTDGRFSLTNSSSIEDNTYLQSGWNFGRGATDTSSIKNPNIDYGLTNGSYTISLLETSIYGCSSNISKVVLVALVGTKSLLPEGFSIDKSLVLRGTELKNADIYIYDAVGKLIQQSKNNSGIGKNEFSPGIYFFRINIFKLDGSTFVYSGKIVL